MLFRYKIRAGQMFFLQTALSCENPPPHLGGFVVSMQTFFTIHTLFFFKNKKVL